MCARNTTGGGTRGVMPTQAPHTPRSRRSSPRCCTRVTTPRHAAPHAAPLAPVPQCACELPAHTKVTHFDAPVARHQDVGRLDVPGWLSGVAVGGIAASRRGVRQAGCDACARHSNADVDADADDPRTHAHTTHTHACTHPPRTHSAHTLRAHLCSRPAVCRYSRPPSTLPRMKAMLGSSSTPERDSCSGVACGVAVCVCFGGGGCWRDMWVRHTACGE